MYWLIKRNDDDSFEVVDEDVIDGIAAVGRTIKVRGCSYSAVLKEFGTRNQLILLKGQMEQGASTPDPKRRARKNVSLQF